jgi:hypothetical protein
MRLRDENQKTGHLLTFASKEERADNFSFFFPVEGLEQFDSLLKVIKGIERYFQGFKNNYEFIGNSVADIGRLEEVFSEIDKSRMLRFELEEFLAEDSQFIEDFAKIVIERQIKKESPIFPSIRPGAMATGSNFYDRNKEIEEIWRKVQKGENLLLRAPRRYGKSSILDHISKNPLPGWRICYVDLEGGKSTEDFVEFTLKGLIQKKECSVCLPKSLSALELWKKSESNKLRVLRDERKKIRENWQEYVETILKSIDSGEDRFLLIFDEVSFLLEDMIGPRDQDKNKVNELMLWFREARKKTKRISFILSGSEHLPSFLESFGIDGHLDDLETVHLALFESQVAREFVFLVLAGKKIVIRLPEIYSTLALMGEPIPYFLQLFLDILSRVCAEMRSLSFDQIEKAYHQELLGPESKRYFETIQLQLERYNRYGERYRAGAESILDELAVNDLVDLGHLEVIWKEATESKERFEVILSILQDDFYVKQENGKAFFASKLLKDWWERHGLAGKR